jgi:3D-(3,5/4)-trihydroxycyclohexane-1,2-dione acylhydrolase (decyclizing)
METQAGKSSLRHEHPLNMGSVGVTGSSASNTLAEDADVVLAVGSRLQDFTTGSWALFKNERVRIIGLNTQTFDAGKHGALPLVADAHAGLEALAAGLAGWKAPAATRPLPETKTRQTSRLPVVAFADSPGASRWRSKPT